MGYTAAVVYYRPSWNGRRANVMMTPYHYASSAANGATHTNDYTSCRNNAQVLIVGLTYEACAKAE